MREYIIAFECPATDSFERIAYKVQQKFVGELIRCKDCKYWDGKYSYCEIVDNGRDWDADDYCSMAERREE